MRLSLVTVACAAACASTCAFVVDTHSSNARQMALTLRGGAKKVEINADRLKQPTAAEVQARGAAARGSNNRSLIGSGNGIQGDVDLTGPSSSRAATIKTGTYFALWYLFNVVYNISNKKILNAVPLPWTMATAQLGIGLLYVVPVWLLGLRAAPRVSTENLKGLSKIAACHTAGHVMTVISLGAGAVSFTHIVKSAEPLFSTLMSAIFLNSTFPWQVYATLLPIIAGVSIASLSELSFSWTSFLNAMGSNTAFSLRAIFSKMAMNKPQGENMTPPNLYAVLTAMSFVGLLPLTLAIEGSRIKDLFSIGIKSYPNQKFWLEFFITGLSYYLYNEVAFLALGQVHPITHAVGNTIKRVVVLIASVVAFNQKMSRNGIAGSSLAVAGTLLYSLAKNRYA